MPNSNNPRRGANLPGVINNQDTPKVARRQRGRQIAWDLVPTAFASAFAPDGARKLWAFSFLCPACGFGHMARAPRPEDAAGVRRARCGARVWLVIARVYPARAKRAA